MWNREGTVKGGETKSPTVQPQPVVPPPPLPLQERNVVTWVGKSVIFKGTIVSSEDLTIDGRVEGTIEVRDQGLSIGPDADIRADIAASTVTIHGTVTGNVRASDKVDIRSTGKVKGDVTAPRIVVSDGAVVCGRVETVDALSDAAELRTQLALA